MIEAIQQGTFIDEEKTRINAALNSGRISDKEYCELYAAQQALSWASNPNSARSPYETILLGAVQPPIPNRSLSAEFRDTQAGSTDCSAALRPPSS